MLAINLLGEFQLLHNGHGVTGFFTPRLQSLLAVLLLNHGKSISRHQLAVIFWPDSSEVQARTNVRKLLFQLRQTLPESDRYLLLLGQTVQWQVQANYSLDLLNFSESIQAANWEDADELRHLERAAAVYKGDLLPSCYDDWIVPERDRLRQIFSDALERLISMLEKKRSYSDALRYAHQLLQLDPLYETAYRHLMRLYALHGDRASALRIYHRCVTTLLNELSAEPDRTTSELYERIVHSNTDESTSIPEIYPRRSTPFIGRDVEWSSIQKAWHKSAENSPYCVILIGDAGIGKTRLAEEFLRWVGRQGYSTATAHCYSMEGALAYGPIIEWLRSEGMSKRWKQLDATWLREISRLVPELNAEFPNLLPAGSLTEDWQRQRFFEALRMAVNSNSTTSTAMMIDDLHWCDGDSLAWLHYLLRSNSAGKLLLIGTVRAEEILPGHPLENWMVDLRYNNRLEQINIGPLSETESDELAAFETGRKLDEKQLARVYAETEGHPLFVIETIRMLNEFVPADGELNKNDRQPLSNHRTAKINSPTIEAIIAQRLMRLSAPARDLAGLAATIGRSFTYSILEKASAFVDEVNLVRFLDELWQRRIIREQGTLAYDFSHDKIREAAYNRLSTARRRLLHQQVGEVLEGSLASGNLLGLAANSGDLAGQIAKHFDLAGSPNRAIPFYQQAAENARLLFANEEALRYYRHILSLLESANQVAGEGHPDQRALKSEILERCGDLLLLMTRRSEAKNSFQLAMHFIPSDDRVAHSDLLCKIANTWRDEYQFDDALSIYQQALQILTESPIDQAEVEQTWRECWIRIQLDILYVYYWMGKIKESEETINKVRPVVEQYGTEIQRADFFRLLGTIGLRRNRYQATEELVTYAKRSLDGYQQAGQNDRIPASLFGYGFILLFHGELDLAEPQFLGAYQLADQHGDLSLKSRCLTYLTMINRKKGNLGQVFSLSNQALTTAEAAQMPEYIGAARANLAWASLRIGDLVNARAHALRALELWSQSPGVQSAATPYYSTAIWPLISLSFAQDDIPQAVTYAQQLLEPQRKRLPDPLTTALIEVAAAENSGDLDSARIALQSAIALAETLHED